MHRLIPTCFSCFEDYELGNLLTQTLGVETFDADDLLGELTPEFMDAQSYDWVKRLYNHLHKKEHETWVQPSAIAY